MVSTQCPPRAFSIAQPVATRPTYWPHPKWPSTCTTCGSSTTRSGSAAGSTQPRSTQSQYDAMRMKPCESWPRRLESTSDSATTRATCAGVPLACSSSAT